MIKKLILFIALALAGGCAKPGVVWESYTPELMAEARSSGKPIIADFYAAWCGPCNQLKEHTFTDPRVIAALEPFRRIKVDMSFNKGEKAKKISREFRISGFPTILFFDADGKETGIRLSGFVPPDEMLALISKIKVPEPAVPASEEKTA